MAGEPWDTLHDPGPPDSHWSTDNVGEAAPGVLTPLSWSMCGTTGDRMPGATGQDAVASLFGRVPETMSFAPTRARYPVVACKLPYAMVTTPKAVRAVAAQTDVWWRTEVRRLPELSLEQARAVLADAVQRFDQTLTIHFSGTGGAEMAVISDIWRASRGEITVDDVINNHGFHGPLEGEASSHVWREEAAR